MSPQRTFAFVAAAAVVLSTAGASAQDATPPPVGAARPELSGQPNLRDPGPGTPSDGAKGPQAEVRALEKAIEADRQRLIVLITQRAGEPPPLRDDPQLLEIAERLPRLEEELRQLKELTKQPAVPAVPAKAARP